MALDDGLADDQSHPHSSRLGSEQRLEDLIKLGWVNSCPGIFDGYNYLARIGLGSYFQYPPVNQLHCVDGIHEKVQDNLLQLNFVSLHDGKSFIEVRLDVYFVLLQLDSKDGEDCEYQSVNINCHS